MTSYHISPKEIIEVKQQNPNENILSVDYSKVRATKSDDPTYYLTIMCKRLVGPPTKLSLQAKKIALVSNAKVQPKQKKPKLAFYELTKELLAMSDYDESKWDSLIAANKEYLQACDIIADEWIDLAANDILVNAETHKIILPTKQDINCGIRQTKRRPNRAKGETKAVPLDKPLYRVELPLARDGKHIGLEYKADEPMKEVIYDIRTKQPARVFSSKDSKGQKLTVDNVGDFVSVLSVTVFNVDYEGCISGQGLSMLCKLREMHVAPHKKIVQRAMTEEDEADMMDFVTVKDNVVSEGNIDDDSPKQKKTTYKAGESALEVEEPKKTFSDDEVEVNEPEETLSDEEDEKPKAKVSKKKVVEEVEEDEVEEPEEKPAKKSVKPKRK
jgi:hypothetical protein